MTRKLFSLLLCAVALLLLMGASAFDDDALLIGEETEQPVETAEVSVIQAQQPPEQAAPAEDAAGSVSAEDAAGSVPAEDAAGSVPAEDTAGSVPAEDAAGSVSAEDAAVSAPSEQADSSLLIDGVPASVELSKTQRDGVTYVALAPTVGALDGNAQVRWDAAAGTVTVSTGTLVLTAQVGQTYLVANGRYLYVPSGVQLINGKTVVPLSVLTKAFDAKLRWDAATATVLVERGSGALASGDDFYDQDDLFWLSRVIFAESGNQCLDGRIAVGNVVLNRVGNPAFADTITGVLSQKNQFSTWKNGRLANRTPNAGSVIAAKLVLDGAVLKTTEGALYFDSSANSWASRNRTCVAVVGNHSFYR